MMRNETGASLVEYTLSVAFLLLVLGGSVAALEVGLRKRAALSAATVADFSPCGGEINLSEGECP